MRSVREFLPSMVARVNAIDGVLFLYYALARDSDSGQKESAVRLDKGEMP